MNGNGMKKETGGQDSPQCGTATQQCGTVNPQCGTATQQCGTVNTQCGTANQQCGTASPQSGTTGLLEDLAAGLECMYLSDLRYGYSQSALRFVLPHINPGKYSTGEWNQAAGYIMGTACAYPDGEAAREALVAFSRKKADDRMYGSREDWYGNRD
ncbi:hypothetical protein LK536_02495 [Lachnoclostridium pacaense]|uniref:hypothetical protein n=1 Tax=Enterocloster hominis (ex Hitch et al. 2024) TaxID=1917870 RepID=UPI001D117DD3|nr:hypothetical protein [Lachnoclostridium pacaense]MCC2875135.1 hypothetical protein [Lachnoclostridium pacaense]